MTNKTIMLSGGFDPLHIGHVQMIEHAARYGKVIVVVNSDDWLLRKKGYVFMPMHERCHILASVIGVHQVRPMKDDSMYALDILGNVSRFTNSIYMQDDDDTAIDAIRVLTPDYFANGADRTKENVPEQAICDALSVQMLWGTGGENKPQSSSWLVNNAIEQMRKQNNNQGDDNCPKCGRDDHVNSGDGPCTRL